MEGYRRGSGRQLVLSCALLALAVGLPGCAPAIGGGVLVAVVATGALTARCYDYLDVAVYDIRGHRTCQAVVTASQGNDVEELKSCYYAPLSDGHWTVRARLPGFPDATTEVEVDHERDCIRHVQSLELTINPQGYVSGPRPHGVMSTPAPLPPPPVAPLPAPAVAPESAPRSAEPTEKPGISAPPVGTFPDSPATR